MAITVPKSTSKHRATIDDLYGVEEKAEIVNGEIVRYMATGGMPGYAEDVIFVSLFQYSVARQTGVAVGDNKGFRVTLPNRESFSPDAAYYIGPDPGMRFYEGAPVFAVEVRSENDYGLTAEAEMAAKRRDYFAAGTAVVWDVDLLDEAGIIVRKYTPESGADRPERVFRRGEAAEAEPAVPGWSIRVDDLFRKQATKR